MRTGKLKWLAILCVGFGLLASATVLATPAAHFDTTILPYQARLAALDNQAFMNCIRARAQAVPSSNVVGRFEAGLSCQGVGSDTH